MDSLQFPGHEGYQPFSVTSLPFGDGCTLRCYRYAFLVPTVKTDSAPGRSTKRAVASSLFVLMAEQEGKQTLAAVLERDTPHQELIVDTDTRERIQAAMRSRIAARSIVEDKPAWLTLPEAGGSQSELLAA